MNQKDIKILRFGLDEQTINSDELSLLGNCEFVQKLYAYTHKDTIERIREAWLDTLPQTFPTTWKFSKEFYFICVNIMQLRNIK